MKKALIGLLLAAAMSGCAPSTVYDACNAGVDASSCLGDSANRYEYCEFLADNAPAAPCDQMLIDWLNCRSAVSVDLGLCSDGYPGYTVITEIAGEQDRACAEEEMALNACTSGLTLRSVRSESDYIRCNDGTLSPTCTSPSSGCCSHHGGIAR